MWCVIIVCLFFASAVHGSANSLKDPYICGPPSCAEWEKFKYLTEVIYYYEYKVNVETYFAGSSNNRSTLEVKAIAAIQLIKPCEGLLQLSDVILTDQDESYPVERAEKFTIALQLFDLRFAFQDGIISEICPEEEEEDWVLNFKRAVLSLFQNSMKRFDANFNGIEQDIHGKCGVNYTVRGQENTSLVLVKTRDLTQCSNRYKYMSILQTERYDFQSKFQTWPVLKSESKCRITVDHNIYNSVYCRERHLFEPFSGKNSGAMTTVIQDLVLKKELNKTDSEVIDVQPKAWSAIQRRSNLLHYHTTYLGDDTGGLRAARELLKLLCIAKEATDGESAGSVDENMDSGSTVGLWGRFVRAARPLHYPALSQLLSRADSICPRATKHILDALPYIASAGSVELIKDMIMRGAVDDETRHEWLMSMAMIPRPKLAMLDSMLELLQNQRYDRVVSFTVSSMVHSYCRNSGKSLRECCEENSPNAILEEFQTIVTTIASKGIIKTKEDRKKITIAIKALGNIGGFKADFGDALLRLVGDELASTPVRLAAVDAFRRTECADTREYFLEMYRSKNVDIEVRLACYLQVMRCPDLSIIRRIFHTLRHEPVNQAATFVWSHLQNLGSSSLPSRVEIQGLLSGNSPPGLDAHPDFRTFSRSYEHSVFYDQFNAGGNCEANVIFSPDSYIPRSLSLNLTVDMFGESINLFEMKVRGEGFEKYYEKLFQSLLDDQNAVKQYIDILRSRLFRSADDADNVRGKIDDLHYKNQALKHRFPLADLGIKVFGNEISYWSVEGDDEISNAFRFNIQEKMRQILSGTEISYNKASLFLDTTFSVPTGCGLPMKMNLMGTSYVNTKMSGTVQNTNENFVFEAKLRPSVAVNVAATMSVTADGLSSSGIRVNWRLYTATGIAAKLSRRGWDQVKLHLELPDGKQEIFAAKSELIVLHGEQELQQQGLNKNRIEENTCSWSTFDNAIGIKVCASYQFPNMTNIRNAPYFLMSGPAKYIVSLEKADRSAKTYAIEYRWDRNLTDNDIRFTFDTPGSKEKRMIDAGLSFTNSSAAAALTAQTGASLVEARANFHFWPTDKLAAVSFEVDGRKQFAASFGLQTKDIKMGWVWLPAAVCVVNDEKIAELNGAIKVKNKGGITQSDVTANFQTLQLASELRGFYTVNGPTHGAKLQLDYQFYTTPKQTIKLEGTYSQKSMGYRKDKHGDLSMEFSAYPVYNFYAISKIFTTISHSDVSFNVSASRESKDDPSVMLGYKLVKKTNVFKIDTSFSMRRPKLFDLAFQYQKVADKYALHLTFRPGSRPVEVSALLFYPHGTQTHADAELNVTLPTLHPFSVLAKVHEKQPKAYQVNAQGIWFTGLDFNVDARYHDQSTTSISVHHVKVMIQSSQFQNIALDGRFTKDNRLTSFVGQCEYNAESYRTIVRYVELAELKYSAYGELDVGGKVYSGKVEAYLGDRTQLALDLHFDQLRDVHISYERTSLEKHKRLSAALNWDANRNPSQKVSIDVQLNTLDDWHRTGQLDIFYPDRMISGEFDILLKEWFCQWHIGIRWASDKDILWKVKMYSEAHEETVYALLSNMNTPFEAWQDTSLNLIWRYHDNLHVLNASMNMNEKYLECKLLLDYLFKSNEYFGEISALVNSTFAALPTVSALAKHRLVWKKSADTVLSFRFKEDGLLMINSSWSLDRGHKENNITGRVTLLTPFAGFTKGYLKTAIMLGHKRDLKGIIYSDLEGNQTKIDIDGYMRRITNCMLVVNVTQQGSLKTSARIGFVENDGHLVAMVVTPNITTGIEVILKLLTMRDFHMFGHVALPVQNLNRVVVIAKRKPREMDFRVGWNALNFGFTCIWQFESLANVVYLFKLFTPLEGFEENGLVLKNVYRNGLDTELSVRLSTHKFGIAILLEDNGKGIIEIIQGVYEHGIKNTDKFVDNFDTKARVVLDTLYYPTVVFDAHCLKFIGNGEEDIVEANATLHLPGMTPLELTDVFVLEQYSVMRNTLNLVTPFQAVKQLKSVYTFDLAMNELFNMTCLVLLYNGTYWHEISAKAYYEIDTGEDDTYQSHAVSLALATPLAVLPGLELHVAVRHEDALIKMAASVAMPSFAITAVGNYEVEDTFVETSGSLNLTSAILEDYFIKMQFKKDITDVENIVSGGIQIQQGEHNNFLFTDVVWQGPVRYWILPLAEHLRIKASGALYPVLSEAELSAAFAKEGSETTLQADFSTEDKYYSLRAEQRPAFVLLSLSSPHEGVRAVKIVGEARENDIEGSFTSDNIEYGISGKILNREPLELSLVLVPKGQGETMNIRVKIDGSDTVHSLSAHFTGPFVATVHTSAEMEENFTDINLKVDIANSKFKDIYFKSRMDNHPELRRVVSVQAAVPLKRLQFVKADADFMFGPKTGYLLCNYELPDMKGVGDLKWSFLNQDLFIKALGHQNLKTIERSIDLDIYFGSNTLPDNLPVTNAGFRMDLDRVWQIGANGSIGMLLPRRIHLIVNAILPKPNVDVHSLYVDSNSGTPEDPQMAFEATYRTDVTKIVTGVKGFVLILPESFDTNSTITWTSSDGRYLAVADQLQYRWDVNGSHHVVCALASPLYAGRDTFAVRGSFQKDMVHGYYVIKGQMHQPGWVEVGDIDLRSRGAEHTDGHFNISTPFKKLPWLKAIFDINNQAERSNNKVHVFWHNVTASWNNTHRYVREPRGFRQAGSVAVSVPLHSQHLVNLDYHYWQGETSSNGNTTIDFDGERFVKGSFDQAISKSHRNLDLTTTDIEVENAHTPVGIKYIHEYDQTGNTDVKQGTVFHLQNATKFNVTGKLDTYTYDIGKNVKFTAMQGNKTWTFTNEYEAVERELKQGSKVQWAPDVWIHYDIHVTNMSSADTESQKLIMNVLYPMRSFNLDAVYSLQETLLEGSAALWWNIREANKTSRLRGRWESPPQPEGSAHKALLQLTHPSFNKDVTLHGEYTSSPAVMSNLSLELQYSDYENEYLKLHSVLKDHSSGSVRDYSFALACAHPSTNLDLDMKSNVHVKSRWYQVSHYYRFQKSLFYEKLRHNNFSLDLNNNAVQWERTNETFHHKINGSWVFSFPEYKVFSHTARPTGNDSGAAVLSLADRSLVAHLNSTDDISYHLIGRIIDTRFAILDVWRDFDDVTTVDLSSYIRLNHSRLLTSKVSWRPKIFAEIKSQAYNTIQLLYRQINDSLVIVKESPMEAHTALRNIWTDAKPRVRDLLNDFSDLHVIKEDLDEFETFLNESYTNNDLYVKDIVEFTYSVLDELAITNHLENLPGIVNDMVGMMGNTTQSIKTSLTFVVESIKNGYTTFLDSINNAFEVDVMVMISNWLEDGMLQYDQWIRDFQMWVTELWQHTYATFTQTLYNYYRNFLKAFEPTFFYVFAKSDGLFDAVSKTLTDFFTDRSHELYDTPYFNYVATYGHALEKLFKDAIHNSLKTNIKKYSKIIWDKVWSKVEKYIPFKDEMTYMYEEIKNTWNNFQQMDVVVYIKEKCQEGASRLQWWYDYFLIGEASKTVWEIVYNKLIDFSKTALDYEELHRIPKTNFIFDPNAGEIVLEQKLPMSWHAFNRTPDFSEIQEYRSVRSVLDKWIITNRTIFTYAYELRPYLTWQLLPPFQGTAIMTGTGTLVTFDKQVFTVAEPGTFVLTKDYLSGNFTVLMTSNERGQYDLMLLTGRSLIRIDLFKEQVSVGGAALILPARVSGVVMARRDGRLYAAPEDGSGLHVDCHLLFHTCRLEVDGRYYASLGGLLGTYNNEQYDELQLPNGTQAADAAGLARGWNIQPAAGAARTREANNATMCEKIFRNKVSPLEMCFREIDVTSFYDECILGADACTLAHAYFELCTQHNLPVRVPDNCQVCTTPQGDTIENGDFYTMQGWPRSADVVFIVEAAKCNRNMRKRRQMELFVEAFDMKLQEAGFADNRYAVVGFGGGGVYREARPLYVNNKVFTNAMEIVQHFDSFQIDKADLSGNVSEVDMFSALKEATELPFRAAVPKVFLLMPCGVCLEHPDKMDYSTIHDCLYESSATLHILMDGDFMISKKRATKYLFGLDSSVAFTNKDYERLVGDAGLRRQIKLPKNKLGMCASLALESNGTIFAGAKLSGDRPTARRFASVLGARAAQLEPCAAAQCECRAGRLLCAPCAQTLQTMESSFFSTDDIDDLIDMAMDPSYF